MKKILELKNVKIGFNIGRKAVLKAVNGVSFDVYEGETIGLVGESGCGKTTLGRLIKNIYDVSAGSIYYDGIPSFNNFKEELKTASEDRKKEIEEEMKLFDELKVDTASYKEKLVGLKEEREELYQKYLTTKSLEDREVYITKAKEYSMCLSYSIGIDRVFKKEIQMIFQDPYSSLNPRMTVRDIIKEGMNAHDIYHKEFRDEIVEELLVLVGLTKEHANRFPHEFSGGQRQRIGIARALALSPKLLVCDEPTSALDVSIQAQVIKLLKDLQTQLKLTIIFISHDLAMVKYVSSKIIVMYLGKIIEVADGEELYANPLHPYTKVLLSSIPFPDPKLERERKRIVLTSEIGSPINISDIGCNFAIRCPSKGQGCDECLMKLKEINKDHYSSCIKN